MDPSEIVSQYGFPIVASLGMAAIIYYIWKWATQEIATIIDDTNGTLIQLIDRVRALDNDIIRLTQKVDVVMHFKARVFDRENNELHNCINKVKR